MTLALPGVPIATSRSDWARQGIALAVVTACVLLMFARDAADLARFWWTSTTYGHCLFIGPVVAWLVWQRRRELAALTPTAWWPGGVVVAAGATAWLLGEAGSVALGRHVGLVVMLQGAVVTLLGPAVARGLLFPLGYSLFVVPFGQELEPPLQRVTVAIVMPLLDFVGVPAHVDGVLIQAGRYWFEVAEACSGAKFVLAMVPFGALVAATCFRSWRRRAVFLLACIVVPVLANGVRAFATIWAADLTSVETAGGIDHVVYGWLFFALVMAGLLAGAWPWLDRAPDDPAFDPALLGHPVRRRLELVPACLLVLTLAGAGPAWAAVISGRAQQLPARLFLPDVPGWRRTSLSVQAAWEPHYPGADHQLFGRYEDGRGHAVDMAVASFARQAEGRELVGFGVGPLREEDRWVRVAAEPPLAGGSVMRITAPGPVERTVATWYRLRGVTTSNPTRVKIETARARLFGGGQGAAALHLSAEGPRARDAIEQFRRSIAQGDLDRAIDRVAGLR